MGKLPHRRMKQAEQDQKGCMWGFISMFDFRRGGYNRSLLPDKRLGNRVFSGGAGLSPKTIQSLKESDYQFDDDDCKSTQPMLGSGRPSVKKLMEQDMVVGDDGVKFGGSDHECQGQKKSSKFHQQKRKNYSISSVKELKDFENDSYINNAVQEIISRIRQKHGGALHENGLEDDFSDLSGKKQAKFEKQLIEAAEIILHEKIISEASHNEKIHYSREFMDALETLISHKLLFFKLLEDSNSELTRRINSILNAEQSKHSSPNDSVGSHSKKPSLFSRRRARSQEILMSGNEGDEASTHSAVLETGSENLPTSIAATDSAPSLKTKSIFSFTEIKRRFKHAMGKDKDGVSMKNEIVKKVSRGSQVMRTGGETALGKMSPSRNPHLEAEIHPKRLSSPRKSEVESPLMQKISNSHFDMASKDVTLMQIDVEGNQKISNRQDMELARISFSAFDQVYSPTISNTRKSSSASPTADRKLSSPRKSLISNKDSEVLEPGKNVDAVTALSSTVTSSESDDTCSTKLESWDPSPILSEQKAFDEDDESLLSVEMSLEVAYPLLDNDESTDSDILKSEDATEVIEALVNTDSDEQEEHDENCSAPSQIMLGHSCLDGDNIEILDSVTSKVEKPSPISVLVPIYVEDEISPPSTKKLQGGLPVTPLQIRFEDYAPSESDKNTFDLKSSDETEAHRNYIQEILKASGFSWDVVYFRSLASEQLLDSSLYNADVDILSDHPSNKYKLLFDCLNEVLMDSCARYFGGCPLTSFTKHNIRPIPDNESAFREIWQGVEWHLRPLSPPRSLEQMVEKDLAKDGRWMDLRFDAETIGYELEDAILQEVLEDTVLNCFSEDTDILTQS